MEKKVLQIAPNKIGEIKSIYEVKTGIECNCFCPECKKPLVAKNKNKTSNETLREGQKVAHFAHYDGSECSHAPETAIHLLAKKILKEYKTLLLPPLEHNNKRLVDEQSFIFDDVQLEKRQYLNNEDWIQPDAILYKNKKSIYIEFYKTHEVEFNKIEKIKQLDISCLEINVNWVEPLINGKLNTDGIRNLLEKEIDGKIWLHNSQTQKLYDKSLYKELKEKETIIKKNNIEEESFIDWEEEMEFKESKESIKARRNFEIKILKIEEWKKDLIKKGYKFLKVYNKNIGFEEFMINKASGKKRKDEYTKEIVYCPKIKRAGIDNIVEVSEECENCIYYGKIVYDYEKHIACGFYKRLKRVK